MEHYAKLAIHFLQLHPQWGIFFAFIISFAESFPVLGTIIPGSITMTAIGTLMGSSVLPTTPTMITAIVGAFVGDLLGYKLGNHYDTRIRNIWPFKKYGKLLDLGEAFFKKHGGKSVIIGRFV